MTQSEYGAPSTTKEKIVVKEFNIDLITLRPKTRQISFLIQLNWNIISLNFGGDCHVIQLDMDNQVNMNTKITILF